MSDKVRKRRDRPRPIIALIPNFFTILSLCAGMTGMRYALDERWELSVGLIVIAMVLDGLDGRSARLLNLTSELGAQLDSLADFLSFGVAPAFVVYLWTLNQVPAFGWAVAMLFAACCALRLARFNVENDDPKEAAWKVNFFTGIPAPAAAGCVLILPVASFVIGDIARMWWLNAFVMLATALMMISTVPTFSIKKAKIAPNRVLPVLVMVVVVLVFLITEPWATLMVIGLGYVASIPYAIMSASKLRKAEAGSATGSGGGSSDNQSGEA